MGTEGGLGHGDGATAQVRSTARLGTLPAGSPPLQSVPQPPPAWALPPSLCHTRAYTHRAQTREPHTHRVHITPSFGQDTAQCSEAPFSIFVVTSAWLLRERGGAGRAGKTGAVVAVRQSGLGSEPGAQSSASPTAAGTLPPGPGFIRHGGQGVQGPLSAILSLPIYPLLAGTCILPMWEPWVPAWLPSTCWLTPPGDPHSPLSCHGGGGVTGRPASLSLT